MCRCNSQFRNSRSVNKGERWRDDDMRLRLAACETLLHEHAVVAYSMKAWYKYIKLVTYGTAPRRPRLARHERESHTGDIYLRVTTIIKRDIATLFRRRASHAR